MISWGISSAEVLARVNGDSITVNELLKAYRLAATANQGPENTPEGKEEFLERVISTRLLSQYFRDTGLYAFVDTTPAYRDLIEEYKRGQYIQALYQEAIPEARDVGLADFKTLMELSRAYVDSLQKAYNLQVDEKAVTFIADRSVVRGMQPKGEQSHGEPQVYWPDLFTEEEKEMVGARFLDGVVTIGEFVDSIEELPPFARPTGGNSDQIAITLEHFAREKVIEHEFYKLHLEDQPYFRGLVQKKKEELLLDDMFTAMKKASTVTEEEVREYYEKHRDDFVTQPLISLAVMTFDSEDVARRAAERVSQGQDFASVAIDFSAYSGSESGYDTTGYISRDKSTPLFDAIWEKEIGATAGPIQTMEGWKVAKLLGRLDQRLLSLEEATPMVVDKVKFVKANQGLEKLLADLRSAATVEINHAALEAVELRLP
jgi:peptidyl-prolyl cis-trans isomerase C